MNRQSFAARAWRQFKKRKAALAGLVVVVLLVLVAAFADFIASDEPILLHLDGTTYLLPNMHHVPALEGKDNRWLRQNMTVDDWAVFPLFERGPYSIPPLSELKGSLPLGPGPGHPLGTDTTGRDVLARLVHGTRISLAVGVVSVGIYLLIGTLLGLVAGYYGGTLDQLVTRVTEIVMNFPLLFLLLAMQGVLEKTTIISTMVVIGLTGWTSAARLVRAEVLRVRELDFVTASRALGSSSPRILWKHVLPNAMAPLFVTATFGIASAILIEASLSFLGFGSPEPTASWGLLMTDGFSAILRPEARPLVLLPGLAIFLTVTAFNLVGDGLRDAIDPRLQL